MTGVSTNWRLGFTLSLTTAALWGLLPIALKVVLEGMDAYTIVWWRFAISMAGLGAFLALRGALPRLARRGPDGDRAACRRDIHAHRQLRPLSRRARPHDAVGDAGRHPARADDAAGRRRARLPRAVWPRAMDRLRRPGRGPAPVLQPAAAGARATRGRARPRRRAHGRPPASPGRSTASRRSSC